MKTNSDAIHVQLQSTKVDTIDRLGDPPTSEADSSCWYKCFGAHPTDIFVLIHGHGFNDHHYYGPELYKLEEELKLRPERANEYYRRNLDIFSVFLSCQCSPYPENRFHTPILAACDVRVYQSRSLFQLLLKYGANVNQKDEEGNSAILRLVSNGGLSASYEMLTLSTEKKLRTILIIDDLLNAGLDINSRNNYQRNVLHLLSTETRPKRGFQVWLGTFVYQNTLPNNLREEYFRYFIEKGADVNAQDEEGKSPLHYSVESSYDSLIGILLDHGVDRFLRDKTGKTALDLAKEGKHETAIRLLAMTAPTDPNALS